MIEQKLNELLEVLKGTIIRYNKITAQMADDFNNGADFGSTLLSNELWKTFDENKKALEAYKTVFKEFHDL